MRLASAKDESSIISSLQEERDGATIVIVVFRGGIYTCIEVVTVQVSATITTSHAGCEWQA